MQVSRQSLLSLAMLGVLLASVGAAWMIISSHRAHWREAAVRGAELIADIRAKGLGEYWTDHPVEDWYLLRDPQDQPIGWRYASRTPATGGYGGRLVNRFQANKYREAWQLDAGAITGTYSSEATNQPSSAIRLSPDGLTVQVGDRTVIDPVPQADYVPEGMLELVAFLASSGEQDIAGKVVFVPDAFDGEKIRYRSFLLTPLGERMVQLKYAGPGRGSVYSFDAAGRIESITHLDRGIIVERASRREVMLWYPEAMNITADSPAPQPAGPRAIPTAQTI